MPPTSQRPFYGWAIVAALVLFSALVVGLAGANIAIFIGPMIDELGWSPAVFGWAQMARLEAVIVAGPIIGRTIDRHGPRYPVAIAGTLTSALVVVLAYVNDEWQLIAIFLVTGLLGIGRAPDLFVAAPVAKWFVRRRGLAMGIALAGTPLGVVVFYPLSQLVIEAIGWRDAWLVFGVAGLVVTGPLALLVLRRQPEDLGLLPDGATQRPTPLDLADAAIAEVVDEVSWTRAEAVRNRQFWLLVLGFTLFTYGWSTITIYRVPHFVERGLDPTLVAFAIATDAAVAIVVSVALGRVSERVAPRYVLVMGIGGLMVSAGALIVVDSIPLLFVANLGYGIGFQAGHVAQSMMWANYYGRRHAGEIRGVSLPLIFGLGATAFPVTGLIRDVGGAYTPAWVLSLATFALAAAILVGIRQPARQRR